MFTDYDDNILALIAVEEILSTLDPEEYDIIVMWFSGDYTLDEIGRVVGEKYHGEPIKPSVLRYHRNKIIERLRARFNRPW